MLTLKLSQYFGAQIKDVASAERVKEVTKLENMRVLNAIWRKVLG